jgi:hypothetical protein
MRIARYGVGMTISTSVPTSCGMHGVSYFDWSFTATGSPRVNATTTPLTTASGNVKSRVNISFMPILALSTVQTCSRRLTCENLANAISDGKVSTNASFTLPVDQSASGHLGDDLRRAG